MARRNIKSLTLLKQEGTLFNLRGQSFILGELCGVLCGFVLKSASDLTPRAQWHGETQEASAK